MTSFPEDFEQDVLMNTSLQHLTENLRKEVCACVCGCVRLCECVRVLVLGDVVLDVNFFVDVFVVFVRMFEMCMGI